MQQSTVDLHTCTVRLGLTFFHMVGGGRKGGRSLHVHKRKGRVGEGWSGFTLKAGEGRVQRV